MRRARDEGRFARRGRRSSAPFAFAGSRRRRYGVLHFLLPSVRARIHVDQRHAESPVARLDIAALRRYARISSGISAELGGPAQPGDRYLCGGAGPVSSARLCRQNLRRNHLRASPGRHCCDPPCALRQMVPMAVRGSDPALQSSIAGRADKLPLRDRALSSRHGTVDRIAGETANLAGPCRHGWSTDRLFLPSGRARPSCSYLGRVRSRTLVENAPLAIANRARCGCPGAPFAAPAAITLLAMPHTCRQFHHSVPQHLRPIGRLCRSAPLSAASRSVRNWRVAGDSCVARVEGARRPPEFRSWCCAHRVVCRSAGHAVTASHGARRRSSHSP